MTAPNSAGKGRVLLTADDVVEVFHSGLLVEALPPGLHITVRQVAAVLEALQPRVQRIAERAWDEGWKQGTKDAWQNGGHESKPNPYRVGDDDTPLTPAAWECDNYRPPLTCLTAPSSETGRCDQCRTRVLSPADGGTS